MPSDAGYHQLHVNPGVEAPPGLTGDGHHQIVVNPSVRPWQTTATRGHHQIVVNATGDTPTPRLWWISPVSGVAGDEVTIVGVGLGSSQGQYAGVVELGDDLMTVISWTAIAATETPGSIDGAGKSATTWHQQIRAQVPEGSQSGLVTVTTDGP